MSANLKKIFLFLTFLFFPFFVLALVPQLDYPKIGGIDLTKKILEGEITLTEFARYIYYFFVTIGGIAIFVGLLVGGFKWLTAGGNPAKISDAKRHLSSSFFGALLLLGSWIILHTLDPQLVVFPIFSEKAQVSDLKKVPEEEFKEGFILRGTLFNGKKEPFELPINYGNINVPDMDKFPFGPNNFVDFLAPPFSPDEAEGQIETIEFVEPEDQSRHYGVACFSKKHFRGRVRIFFSKYDKGEVKFGFPIKGFLGLTMSWGPCVSFFAFVVPEKSRYALGDNIIFYEYPFHLREKKGGRCLKLDTTGSPQGCEMLSYIGGLGLVVIPDEKLSTGDPKGLVPGRFVTDPKIVDPLYYPYSLEVNVRPPDKYLIFLFSKDPGPQRTIPHWELGEAYWLQSDVPDFQDPNDERLYWTEIPWHDPQPRSYLIFQVEAIY